MKLAFLLSTLQLLFVSSDARCSRNQSIVKVHIKTDDYPGDTHWEFREPGARPLWEKKWDYSPNTLYTHRTCMDNGKEVEFTIMDKYSDGICCEAGQGYYKVEVRQPDGTWWEAIKGGDFYGKEEKHTIHVGPNFRKEIESRMTSREKSLLDEHNKRRKDYHVNKYGVSYVPLKWSEELKYLSQKWADSLLDECGEKGVYHDKNAIYGESITGQLAKSGSSLGVEPTPDMLITRFVERESTWEWPRNSHLTTTIWRPSQYVGCAEASKIFRDSKGRKKYCHRLVCRYAKPTNCQMKSFTRSDGTIDFEKAMTQDDSKCGPFCPPEGCFH